MAEQLDTMRKTCELPMIFLPSRPLTPSHASPSTYPSLLHLLFPFFPLPLPPKPLSPSFHIMLIKVSSKLFLLRVVLRHPLPPRPYCFLISFTTSSKSFFFPCLTSVLVRILFRRIFQHLFLNAERLSMQ